MRRSLHRSAAQVAKLAIVGGLIMSIGFILPGLMYERFLHSGLAYKSLLVVPPFFVGTMIMGLALNHFRSGMKDGRWPSAEIEALRAKTESRYWRAALIALAVFWVASRGRVHQFAWGSYPLYLALLSLHNQLNYPNDRPGASIAIVPAQPVPLNSEHWGQH